MGRECPSPPVAVSSFERCGHVALSNRTLQPVGGKSQATQPATNEVLEWNSTCEKIVKFCETIS